jgi:RHS repeat-associated protein
VALDHQIDYTWNEHSQLASVKSLAGEFVYEYDEKTPALLTKMTGPVHIAETRYEPHRNLVTGVTNRFLTQSAARRTDEDTKGKVVSSYTYSNDLLGRRETISQGGSAFTMLKLGENKVDVAYNDRSEVTGATYRSGTETQQSFEYAYDGIGNRTTARSTGVQSAVGGGLSAETHYKTNALNQYTVIKSTPANAASSKLITKNQEPRTTSHDLDGNLIEDAQNRYTWNADNNLIRVDSKDGKLRLDYTYDYQSRRTVGVEIKEPGTKNEEQRTTYFLYDDWNMLAEIDSVPAAGQLGTLNFKPATLYSWGRDLSGSLQGAGGVGGLLAISKVNPGADEPGGTQLQTSNLELETLFPTYDANGNIGQLINADANVVAAYIYDPFGNVTEMAGAEAAENPWRFSTKPVEAGTGWLYYGYRWYDAENGRWVNRDPIEESGGVNLYGFVGNDGISEIDLLGLRAPTISPSIFSPRPISIAPPPMSPYSPISPFLPGPSSPANVNPKPVPAPNVDPDKSSDPMEDLPPLNDPDTAPKTCPQTCSDERLEQLNELVKRECHGVVYGCPDPRAAWEYEVLKSGYHQALRCLRARERRERECYNGGDVGHAVQFQGWKNRVERCRGRLQRYWEKHRWDHLGGVPPYS